MTRCVTYGLARMPVHGFQDGGVSRVEELRTREHQSTEILLNNNNKQKKEGKRRNKD